MVAEKEKNLVGRTIKIPLGDLWLVASEDALLVAEFIGQKHERPFDLPETMTKHRILDLAEGDFRDYFAGKQRAPMTPLAGAGTPFQKKVWQGLCKIPHGETRSYGELAKSIGKPTAVRAVGMANSRNPISILVPCHRVIGANGTLTGYAGGLERKRWLLEHENMQQTFLG